MKNNQHDEPVAGEDTKAESQETNTEEIQSEEVETPTEAVKEEVSEEEKLQFEVADLKDKILRLYSEFDNFKKRTAKERVETTKTAGMEVIIQMLSILDDFDRAQKSIAEAKDVEAVKEGVNLIHNKLKATLESKGLEEMKSVGTPFNTDLHEAITNIPAPTEDLKGKVVDELEKGYYLNGKVIRYAKVVVGQ